MFSMKRAQAVRTQISVDLRSYWVDVHVIEIAYRAKVTWRR